jgi:hypothetical protein
MSDLLKRVNAGLEGRIAPGPDAPVRTAFRPRPRSTQPIIRHSRQPSQMRQSRVRDKIYEREDEGIKREG